MTSELTSEAPREEMSPPAEEETIRGDRAARLHFRISLAFLAAASLLMALTAARVVLPDSLSDVAVLSYGRLLPVALALFLYGWLTIGLIGAGYFILPRVAGKPFRHESSALAAAGLLAVGYLGGAVAVALGDNDGGQYLEFPLWADAVVLVGLLLVARVFTGTIAQRTEESLAAPEWYFGSAPVWLLLSHLVGNIPGISGVNETLQTTFYRGALFGLWFAAAGIGVVYYLVLSITGRDPRRITQLSVAGFWSLAFVIALSGGSRLTYTAAPDWYETMSGVFSIALFLPVAIILVDVATALRGRRAETETDAVTLRFLIAGSVSFLLVPVINLALSLRSSSAIVGMTDWVTALDTLAVVGAFTFWMLAYARHASVAFGWAGFGAGRAHFAVSLVAVAVLVGEMLVSGLQAGLGWVAAANSGEASVGEVFRSTAGSLDGQQWVRLAALGVFAGAQLFYFLSTLRTGRPIAVTAAEAEAAEPDTGKAGGESEETDDFGGLPAGAAIRVSRLRTGTVGIFAVVVLFGFVFPAFEAAHGDATLLANARADDRLRSPGIEKGREIYVAEGCWYCHTQQARGIVTDVGLLAVSQPGDYVGESPMVTGAVRVGPDLTFVGSRDGITAAWLAEFIADPRSKRSWSTMPAYGYLGDDLEALADYVASLRIHEFE